MRAALETQQEIDEAEAEMLSDDGDTGDRERDYSEEEQRSLVDLLDGL
jgi:hypothetical protein